MKSDREFKFYNLTPRIKDWRFFSSFYLFPTLTTYSYNSYEFGKKYMFTRCVDLCFLWFVVGISWKYGKSKNN